ncbi:hypothetical protein SDC9_211330 [bioreactor metagenome]|uniref:Uncharacterized protein n=1 Tax=bioreactor metagenome TaxID=1076179 RepID=A0A645JJF7_9ZZZZ
MTVKVERKKSDKEQFSKRMKAYAEKVAKVKENKKEEK